MDMQLDVTDQVLDVASERTKCCIAEAGIYQRPSSGPDQPSKAIIK
ncbi:hypothetical protein T4E_5132 [Trichinella pseudospiralis]|uniref:Uncharacterized protein n=1 Tax=Trichinella pseudospiralis TaxID=6337 RepID=A0A0V0YNE7_TRIPS|nr:hypothetical protein T4E_5132 [Trichinella pseudospiralis]